MGEGGGRLLGTEKENQQKREIGGKPEGEYGWLSVLVRFASVDSTDCGTQVFEKKMLHCCRYS